MRYPDADRLDLVEDLHGHSVADPYRWLEDAADPRTQAWTEAQDAVTAEVLDGLSLRAEFAARLEELVHAGAVGVPVWRGERAFSTRRDPGQEHAVLRVREADGTRAGPARPDGAGPRRNDDARRLVGLLGGRPAGLPAVHGRRRGVEPLRARRRDR